MMDMSVDGKVFLIGLEGICLSPYLDSVGVKTLAIGATVSELPYIENIPWDTKISMQEALDLLDVGLTKYVNAVNSVLDVPVAQNQFDALVSCCYNIGTGKVKARQGGMAGSTIIKRINAGSDMKSIVQAFLMWNKPPEIIGRRTKEANLFSRGTYGDGKALVFPVNPNTHKPMYSKGYSVNVKELI